LSVLRAATDMAEALVGLSDITAIQAKLIEIRSKLRRANNEVFAAQDERVELLALLHRLELEVADFNANEKKRQQLTV
jgi:hypothetical protein